MKRKCKVCFKGNINAAGRCDNCGEIEGIGSNNNGKKPFYGHCEMCGSNGRLVELGFGKEKISFYRCYECTCAEYEKERQQRAATCPQCISLKNQAFGTPDESKYWTPEEANYQKALNKYYLRPRYYNQPPDWKMLQKYADALSPLPVKQEPKEWFDR